LLKIKKLKIILFLAILCFALAGCTNPTTPSLPSEGDDTYTITVVSKSDTVYGTVYINGLSTGIYLSANTSVQIDQMIAGDEITMMNDVDFESHAETFNPPQTTINFYWF